MASVLHRSFLLFPRQQQRLIKQFPPGVMCLSTTRPLDARRTNTCINFVPQQEAWIVERFGKYLRTLEPGLNILIPIVDTIKYVQSLKETAVDIPSQSAITEDNVTLHLDGVLYYRVIDPFKTSYGVEDAEFAVIQLAQTTMRSELGKIKLDSVFQERTNLNFSIVDAINHAADAWGIRCMRYEIKDIQLPTKVRDAMQMQHGNKAASLSVAEQYVQAFGNLAKASNTVLLPEKTGDISSMVGQAMAIYGQMTKTDPAPSSDDPSPPPNDKLSDFENMLDKLNKSIDDTLTQRFESSTGGETVAQYEEKKKQEDTEEPHFTLATSGTRNNPRKTDDY
uniref:Band 7 domain-containing protein n=1 Tax=Amphimedon queenslandica TaxID=400682 RepID=A0A1X7UXW2_AMPQE